MKLRALLAGLVIAASASSAMAAGPYMGLSAGVSIFDKSTVHTEPSYSTASYDTGYGFNLSGGYSFDPIRVEGEIGYKAAEVRKISMAGVSTDITDTDFTVLSVMVNGYYDVKTPTPLTPFVGAGIGPIVGIADTEGDTYHDATFGYQLMAGLSYNLAQDYNIDLLYRFQGAVGDLKVQGLRGSYHSNNILLGLRSTF